MSSTKKVFKSRIPSCRYVFKDGKHAPFIGGEYYTSDTTEIAELKAEIAANHPFLFIDENKKEIDTDKIDPIEEIRRKAVEDYIASQKQSLNKTNDRGTSTQERLNVANSTSIAEGSGDSNSTGAGAQEEGTGEQKAPASAPKKIDLSSLKINR